VWSHMAREFQ